VQASPHHHRAPRTRRSRRSSAGPETSSQRAAISVRPRQSSGRPASITRAPRGLLAGITWRATGDLKPYPNNPRRHPESQIAGLMKSIDLVWTNPILIDESATILAGHCRLEAAKRLGMADVPTITIAGLSDSEKRAIVIADNRLPERAVWDFDLLREHFRNLIEVDFEVELSGFTTGEIDLVMDGKPAPITANDPADDLTGFTLSGPAVSHLGDIWELGRHRLVCGDALRRDDYEQLLGGDLAQMLVSDPPYNVKIDGHAMGRGKVRHREFAMASGEMSEAAYVEFDRDCQPSRDCATASAVQAWYSHRRGPWARTAAIIVILRTRITGTRPIAAFYGLCSRSTPSCSWFPNRHL
jgi:hypothetical protein